MTFFYHESIEKTSVQVSIWTAYHMSTFYWTLALDLALFQTAFHVEFSHSIVSLHSSRLLLHSHFFLLASSLGLQLTRVSRVLTMVTSF